MGTSTRIMNSRIRAKLTKGFVNGEFGNDGGVSGFGSFGKTLFMTSSGKTSSYGKAVLGNFKKSGFSEVFINIAVLAKRIRNGEFGFTNLELYNSLSRLEKTNLISELLNLDSNSFFRVPIYEALEFSLVSKTRAFIDEFGKSVLRLFFREEFFEELLEINEKTTDNEVSNELCNLANNIWEEPFGENILQEALDNPEELLPKALNLLMESFFES